MGAGEIDSLEIQVQATAQKANQQLDILVGKLDRLTTSLGRVNANSLVGLSNGVQRLATSMQSMKNIGTADFTRLAKNIQKMGSLDSKQLGKAAGSIHRFVNALGTIDKINVSDNAAQIGQLAKGISQLGYKSSTQAIENIPKLAKAMRQLMTELSKAPKVSQNLIQMTNALAKLSRTGASSGRAASSLGSALDRYTASTHRARKGSFSLASAIGKVYATYWMLFRAMGLFRKAIDISSQLTEVQNVVDVTFGDMSSKVDEFAKHSIEQFGMSELSVKQYASRFQAMGSAMGISGSSIGSANNFLNKQTNGYVGLSDSMSDVSLNLTKLTADMASFYNVEQSVVAEDLESIFTGQTRPLRQYGLDLTQATLQEWALKNGIDANVQSMSQAEKTMLRYQYVLANTGAAQGDFARTANTWANQVRILKQNFQQLGAIVGGTLINAFKPLVQALNSVMGKLIAFAETVSNALGKIFGWKFEKGSGGAGTAGLATDMSDAADSAGGLADNTGKAAKNIDKMKAGLRAFDELKTINMPDSNSGSGGGSGSGGSGGGASGASGSGGQWVKQDSIFEDYKSSIDSLKGLGNYIRDAIIGQLDGIKWEKVYEHARAFGTGLANFLNGLFEPDKEGKTLFGELGTTIAGTLNTILHGLDSFGETFDWTQFGSSIADGINNFFSTFDFGLLADTINTWVHGVLNAIIKFVRKTDWQKIGTKIGEFLAKIDWLDALSQIGQLIIEAASAALKAWKGSFDAAPLETAVITAVGLLKFTGLGAKLLKNIKSAIVTYGSLNIGKITVTVAGITFAWAAGTAVGEMMDKAIGELWAEAGDQEMADQYMNFKWTGEGGFFDQIFGNDQSFLENMQDVWDGLKLMLDDIGNNELFKAVKNGAAAGKIKELYKELKKVAKVKINDIKLKLKTKAADVKKWWDDVKGWWKDKAKKGLELAAKIVTKAKELWDKFKNGWDKFKKNPLGFALSIISKAKDLWGGFKAKWGKSKTAHFLLKIASKASELWKDFNKKWGISKKVSIGIGFLKNSLNNLWTSVKNFFSGKSIGIGASAKAGKKADGGAFYNGSWHPIAQYAAGGFPSHGSVFVAGEAGPELAGHIGGRTEVLNQSQLASTMYSSVLSAMETALNKQRVPSQQPIQVYLDGKVIFDNTREKAREYVKKTGRSPF